MNVGTRVVREYSSGKEHGIITEIKEGGTELLRVRWDSRVDLRTGRALSTWNQASTLRIAPEPEA